MSKFTGRLVEIGIGKEAPRGSGVAADFWIPKTTITFDNKVSKSLVKGSYGNITDAAMTAQVVSRWAEGNIEGEINVNSFGLLLLALVGTTSPTTTEAGEVYTHDYTLQNDVQHDSLSIHVKDPIGSVQFVLAMINSLTIDITLGEYVKYVANFISKSSKGEANPTPAYEIDKRFVHPDLQLKVAADIHSFAAASKLRVKSMSMSIEKDVEKLDVLGTLEPEDIVNKTIRIFGTLELNYEDRTWRNYVLDNSVKAMEFKLVSTKKIGTASYPTLHFVFPKVHFSEWEPARELGDIASQSINFEIMFDLANTRLWSTLQLINSNASY